MKTQIGDISQDDGMFHLTSSRSLNDRLVVEVYKKEGLRVNIQNGFARPDQKSAVKGLKILLDVLLADGTYVKRGSTAYIREEVLHNQAWAQKHLESDTIKGPFMIVERSFVEFIAPPPEGEVA